MDEEELIYLKDWHLMRICEQKNGPKDRDEETGRYVQNDADLFYQVPEIFSDDWMNEFVVSFCCSLEIESDGQPDSIQLLLGRDRR